MRGEDSFGFSEKMDINSFEISVSGNNDILQVSAPLPSLTPAGSSCGETVKIIIFITALTLHVYRRQHEYLCSIKSRKS